MAAAMVVLITRLADVGMMVTMIPLAPPSRRSITSNWQLCHKVPQDRRLSDAG
jgi:hypothetical protein